MCYLNFKNEYKSKNGYFKHYNKEGISCRIKVKKEALNKIDSDFIIAFKRKRDLGWNYHSPKKKFRCINAVINHILKNLENKNMVFKIF